MRFVDTSRIRSRFDQRFPARDGTLLSADVYRPPAVGEYPVLVTRTPYDNNRADATAPKSTSPQVPSDRFKLIAAHGFVVVACDVRGRGDSDGAFVPFAHEAADGADTVRWAKGLPEVDGRVGIFGSGYAGFCALAAATETEVDAVAAWSPFGRADGLPARGGAVRLEWLLWMHLVGGRVRGPVDVPRWGDVHRSRPLVAMHEVLGRPEAAWPTWLKHLDVEDPFWAVLDLEQPLSTLSAPALLVSGWWDTDLAATTRHWDALSPSAVARGHRLIVGPWDTAHTRRPSSQVGGVEWGPAAALDPEELMVDWFDQHLRHVDAAGSGAVRAFVTGRNEWCDFRQWPPAADVETLWLSSAGRANTRVGDGRLTPRRAARDDADRFVHDPSDPVPWQPIAESFSRSAAGSFTLGSSHATGRDDTLCYTSSPARAPQLFAGRPVVHLVAESDRADADWIVLLEDVFPGGTRTVHLAHGIVRAATSPDFAPDVPTAYEIALTDIAHELQPGHALRLVVSSSLFPLYAVNLGGADYLHDTEPLVAQHGVHHGPGRPSRLELPVWSSPTPAATNGAGASGSGPA